jgi:hypothetical protein
MEHTVHTSVIKFMFWNLLGQIFLHLCHLSQTNRWVMIKDSLITFELTKKYTRFSQYSFYFSNISMTLYNKMPFLNFHYRPWNLKDEIEILTFYSLLWIFHDFSCLFFTQFSKSFLDQRKYLFPPFTIRNHDISLCHNGDDPLLHNWKSYIPLIF